MPIVPLVFPNPDVVGLKYENLALKAANGETIYAWFIPADDARATILINHGAMFSRSWPLPQVAMAQAAVALPDIVGMIVEGTVELEMLEGIGYEFMGVSPSPEASTFIPAELDPKLTARIMIAKLYLQSAENAITPFAGAKRLFDHSPEPKQFVTLEGIHGFGIFMDPGYSKIVNDLLDEVAPPPAD